MKGLAELRARLLSALSQAPLRQLSTMAGSERLNHLTTDVDALDGLALRLFMPLLSAVIVLGLGLLTMFFVVSPSLAIAQATSFMLGLLIAMALSLRLTMTPSRFAQRAMQALRARYIDSIRAQTELAVAGRLDETHERIMAAQNRLQDAQAKVDKIERLSGFILSASASLAAAASLYIGIRLADKGQIDPALAALGFFAALGLAEAIAMLHRGVSELGRMSDAARRVEACLSPTAPTVVAAPVAPKKSLNTGPLLALQSVSFCADATAVTSRPGPQSLSLTLDAGETLALCGASGIGKSTVLSIICGQSAADSGEILLYGMPVQQYSQAFLLERIALLPQRSTLISGSIFDNLRLARPNLNATDAWNVLDAVQLTSTIETKGGLDAVLQEAGSGLSGGEKRRLALARTLLRRPALLLLDEPTEGLDEATARAVLDGVRRLLPKAAILMASHRSVEQGFAERVITLSKTMPAGKEADLPTSR
nr:ATP-binding cassette domain-containing protein [Allorhizobium sonneratiae]